MKLNNYKCYIEFLPLISVADKEFRKKALSNDER